MLISPTLLLIVLLAQPGVPVTVPEAAWLPSPPTNTHVFNVHDFGAKGDGASNDSAAFHAAAKALQEAGGGTLVIPSGSYVVGEQSRIPGKFPPYIAQPIVELSGLEGLCIEGNGAVIRLADGLRFGSFNKESGEAIDPAMPFLDRDCAVAPGNMFTVTKCRNVVIRNLELDGNSGALILGGQWGDTGRQLSAYGLCLYNNSNVLVENVNTHHHGLDGVIVGWTGLKETDPPTPCLLRNVVSEYNARQGLSWVGGRNLVAINCKFNHTQRGKFGSAPGAGLDIEAEDSVCREGLFVQCEFVDNGGCGVVADSGDGGYTRFVNCTIWGTNNWSTWSVKPGLSYEFCNIYGSAVHGFGSKDPLLATRYLGCRFEDKEYPGRGVYRSAALAECGGGDNITYDTCEFIAHKTRSLWIDGADTREIIRNCRVFHECGREDHDFTALIRGSRIENTCFSEGYPEGYANRYYLEAQNVSRGAGVSVSGPVIRWGNWSGGALGVLPAEN